MTVLISRLKISGDRLDDSIAATRLTTRLRGMHKHREFQYWTTELCATGCLDYELDTVSFIGCMTRHKGEVLIVYARHST